MATWDVRQGDCRELLRGMEDNSVTATLCDPPYGLSFMGKNWDHGVPGVPYWAEALRVCKPGALLLAFGGSRTHHRLMVAIEDAGFEIFDCMSWLYGSGFPKSHDISKAIDREAGAEREVVGQKTSPYTLTGRNTNCYGEYALPTDEKGYLQYNITAPATPDAATWSGYGTALKPAWEPVVLARKPRLTTYAATALEHGSGALNIDGGRIHTTSDERSIIDNRSGKGWGTNQCAFGGREDGRFTSNPQGRWPANLLLSHSPGCIRRGERRVKGDPKSTRGARRGGVFELGIGNAQVGKQIGYADADGLETVADWDCVPDCPVRLLGEQSGVSTSTNRPRHNRGTEALGKGHVFGEYGPSIGGGYSDLGTAARFFKNFDPPLRFCPLSDAVPIRWKYSSKASRTERDAGLEDGRRNTNPCVKPLAVTRYLATLLRPPEPYLDDATILVPFAGSGSEMIGALLAGWRNVVGIELDAEYVAIAEARLAWWAKAMALTHETEPGAILSAMKGRDIDEAVQGEMFNGR